ncbi:MAG TPA: DUF2813 domain-containing protein [Candidatus Saccharimonadales bacterium]|jgi:putative ATP-dependent endonuclease of OLD family|nr:DUF2813 domain-containing protein [Candidatus Saccharimonadales bacterium]
MHLTSLKIENFRGFKQVFLDFDRTTVLIGENNTGKTSVLDAMRLCLGRQLSRRSNPFEDHDYLLETEKSRPGDAGALAITLEFSESRVGEWEVDLVQALGDVIAIRTTGAGDLRRITMRVTSTFNTSAGDFITDWDFLQRFRK